MYVGFPTLEHATYSCPCEKHGSQCCHAVYETFPRKEEKVWEGRRKYHINTGLSDTDKQRDSQGWQHCVVIPLAKRIAETTGKVEKAKECVVPRQSSEGRTDESSIGFTLSFVQMQCKLQVQFILYLLPVSSGFHFHTHACRSLLRVFYALRTVHITPVTPHQHAPHHGYNAIAGECGAGCHLPRTNRHSLPTKQVKNVEKLKYCGPIHILRPPPDQGGDVCKVWFRSVQKCRFV
jgi:hypothetical protein